MKQALVKNQTTRKQAIRARHKRKQPRLLGIWEDQITDLPPQLVRKLKNICVPLDALRGADGRPILPVATWRGRPAYSLEDVERMEPPYSHEPDWDE